MERGFCLTMTKESMHALMHLESLSQRQKRISIRWGEENVPIPGGEENHYPMGEENIPIPG